MMPPSSVVSQCKPHFNSSKATIFPHFQPHWPILKPPFQPLNSAPFSTQLHDDQATHLGARAARQMGGRTSAEAGAAAAAVPAVTPMINSPWVDPFPPWLPPKPSEGESTWSIVGPAQCADRDWVANFVEESAFRNGSFQRCIPLITCGSQQE